MKLHHMTLKKYLRKLEQQGYLNVILDSDLYNILVEKGFYHEYLYSLGNGIFSYRFYFERPEWA